MKKKKTWKKKSILFYAILMLACMLCVPPESVYAHTSDDHPSVVFTPNGLGWSILDPLPVLNDYSLGAPGVEQMWVEEGTAITTGIPLNLPNPGTGQHVYSYERTGYVPVVQWDCKWRAGACCHPTYDLNFNGLNTNPEWCKKSYWSGYFPKCADCGEYIKDYYHYIKKESIQTIQYYNVDKVYYYVCPHNNHLEQGKHPKAHECKAVSNNRYLVKYKPNVIFGVTGEMAPSLHMYNNATTYEGQPVTAQKNLSPNSFVRPGYEFDFWSTNPDGSGQRFADGAEILNLTSENYDKNEGGAEKGVVTLYANWKRSTSTLIVDANGGKYNDSEGTISGDKTTYADNPYSSSLELKKEKLIPPAGYTVQFNTNGGSSVSPIVSDKLFQNWQKVNPATFGGRFEEETSTYRFVGPNGTVDTIKAIYKNGSIILPNSNKEGSVIVGWFEEPELIHPVGLPGDEYTPDRDTTLYAKWEQNLILKAVNDLAVDGGKGGVDLSWTAADPINKIFKIYQKLETQDDSAYRQVVSADNLTEALSIEQSYSFTGTEKKYTVPYSGFYTFEAYGAQGKNYSSYEGGKGGKVETKIWLTAGDVLTIRVGGQNGYNGGGSATTYANGGGMTSVSSQKLNKVILIAGGGGGASPAGNGGAGGESTSLVASGMNGESSMSGGGAGYLGGKGSTYITHSHDGTCKHTHIGDAILGTGCYTLKNICNSMEFNYDSYIVHRYYGDHGNGAPQWCVQCRTPEDMAGEFYYPNCDMRNNGSGGHPVYNYTSVCRNCGKSSSGQYKVFVCTADLGYLPNCGKTDEISCGYTEGQVVSSTIAYGGSSYTCSNVEKFYTFMVGNNLSSFERIPMIKDNQG